jgi:hypothetical protein
MREAPIDAVCASLTYFQFKNKPYYITVPDQHSIGILLNFKVELYA